MDHGEPRGIFIAAVAITLLALLTVSTTRQRAAGAVAAE
jgi:hypothetical protein